jgi:hypothetical protein
VSDLSAEAIEKAEASVRGGGCGVRSLTILTTLNVLTVLTNLTILRTLTNLTVPHGI